LLGLDVADKLYGGDGNDAIDGGAGTDTMVGGTGDDSYVVDAKGDAITEADAGGTDTVRSSVGYALGDFIENLKLTGAGNLNGAGNALDNMLMGNAADNRLSGLDGADVVKGGVGDDKILGGLGIDTLTGNAGADSFIFKADDTTVAKKNADTISDFHAGQGDLIDLHGIDANDGKKGNQHFDFIGTDAFSHHAGELRFEKSNGDTYVSGDTDGDGKADLTVHLDGALKVTDDFFVL